MNDMTKPTKARTQGGKRRAKKARNKFDIAETPKREKSGRAYRAPDQTDARAGQLKARCRQRGISTGADNRRKMSAPWNGMAEGAAIESVKGEQAQQRLWNASQHMVRTWTVYYRAHAMPPPYAKCMSILAPTDAMEADASTPPRDDRTDEEKQRASVTAKMQVEGWLGRISAFAASECKQVVLGGRDVKDEAGLLAALQVVADGLDGKFSRR